MLTRRGFLALLAWLLLPAGARLRPLAPSDQFRLVNGWICKRDDLA
jgi:hypothetical protein